MEFTATIKEARWDPFYSGSLCGFIYEDKNNRFEDGTWIVTSEIMEEVRPNVYKTRNSLYYVVFAEKDEPVERT